MEQKKMEEPYIGLSFSCPCRDGLVKTCRFDGKYHILTCLCGRTYTRARRGGYWQTMEAKR